MRSTARSQVAYELEAIGDHDRREFIVEALERRAVVRRGLQLQHFGGDGSLELGLQATVGNAQQATWWRQHAQHDRDRRRRIVLNGRRLLGTSFEYPLDDGGLSPRTHESDPASSPERPGYSLDCS